MTHDARIEITVDPSLLEHFRGHMHGRDGGISPEAAITRLVAMILDGSTYPVAAEKTGDTQIRLSYHLHSFSQPIFWD